MSRQVRHRVTAVALGGFLLGAALLTTGTANAEQVAGGGRQVVFAGGGVLGFSCRSTPSVESMTVPAGGTVRLVNRTGQGAELRLDGMPMGTVPEDDVAEVVFRRGTTAVTLDPDCALPDEATPVLVTATPTVPAKPDPTPSPIGSTTPGLPGPPSPSGTPATSTGGSSLPDVVPPPTRPHRPPTATRPHRPPAHGAGRPVVVRPHPSRPRSVAATTAAPALQVKTKTNRRGTPAAVVPTFAGMPPGEGKTLLADGPDLDLTSGASQAAATDRAEPLSDVVAAEPVAAMRPMPESRPVGLLALIAAVSVAGVSVGVIRAIVSQRASRSSVA